ncbi:MAG: hypothetical protein ISR82_08525 [Candidatus Marinimicrobia bacterium]|nr:hypothetical protein [Candidatus Neomarinimicrobiota bacterium]MBL7011252.1 hypothetical protein [Candidatus Neomarinimicrobiota bacterium]MBL7031476.1 hypothetical protein [Candidatus Neomarinimicrobiota bacterium]
MKLLLKLSIQFSIITGFSHLAAQDFPPAKPLTDEMQICLVLQKIEQGIKEQNLIKITDGFANEVESNGKSLNRKALTDKFKTTFNSYKNRKDEPEFIKRKPPRASLTTTWDFEMDIDEIKFINDSTALAKTWIYFTSDPLVKEDNKSKKNKKRRNNILFQKVKGEWRVKSGNRIFERLTKDL